MADIFCGDGVSTRFDRSLTKLKFTFEQFHQSKFPDWAVIPGIVPFPLPVGLPAEYGSDGKPLPSVCQGPLQQWVKFYTSQAVMSAWQDFYTNKKGFRDDFAKQWAYIAGKL